jgi:hypothetical protein
MNYFVKEVTLNLGVFLEEGMKLILLQHKENKSCLVKYSTCK